MGILKQLPALIGSDLALGRKTPLRLPTPPPPAQRQVVFLLKLNEPVCHPHERSIAWVPLAISYNSVLNSPLRSRPVLLVGTQKAMTRILRRLQKTNARGSQSWHGDFS